MTEPPQGHYPIERRVGEIERLQRVQSAALAADAATMLDQIGSDRDGAASIWAAAPKGIADLLGQRVGAPGQVVVVLALKMGVGRTTRGHCVGVSTARAESGRAFNAAAPANSVNGRRALRHAIELEAMG